MELTIEQIAGLVLVALFVIGFLGAALILALPRSTEEQERRDLDRRLKRYGGDR